MKRKCRWSLLGVCSAVLIPLCLSLPSQAQQPATEDKTATTLKAILAASHRAEADRVRDQYRHPAETLTWLGVQPHLTVVEIWPGRGWYTDILAPFLR